MIHRHFRALRGPGVAVALSIILAACGGTRLESTWVKPDLGPLNFHNVVAVAFSPVPERRRVMEDTMATQIQQAAPNVRAVPSYTLVNAKDISDESRLRDAINKAGFDGAVCLRVTDVSRDDVYVPGRMEYAPMPYRTFWGYYRYWAPISYEPGYIERDRDVQVETEVYSTADEGTLVYSAVSRTLNPSSASDLVQDVAYVVARDMRAKGLLRTTTR